MRDSKSEYMRRKKANDPEYAERQRECCRRYIRNRRANDPEYVKMERERSRERTMKRQQDKYANDQEWVEQHREAVRKNIQTPEGKVYNRVNAFNQRHPDRAVETPLEAKLKYLETGYIPDYIKNDDLKTTEK